MARSSDSGHNASAVVSVRFGGRLAAAAGLCCIGGVIAYTAIRSDSLWVPHSILCCGLLLANASKTKAVADIFSIALLSSVWGAWGALLLLPAGLLLGDAATAARLGAVVPVLCVTAVVCRRVPGLHGAAGRAMVHVTWDPPLLLTGFIVDSLGGKIWHDGSARRETVSDIDEFVCMGCRPLALHVPQLEAKGVRWVVNMCGEYGGPTAAYDAAGIKQLRLPTVDTESPSLESLEAGVRWLHDARKEGGRVYVHCKGGRARASAMVLCWLVDNGRQWHEVIADIRKRRPVVEAVITKYPAVAAFIRSRGQSP